MAPGDPAYMIYGGGGYLPPEIVASIRHDFGLDKSLAEQFYLYITNMLQGNFGFSYAFRAPVLSVIAGRLPATMLLVLSALGLMIVFGIFFGVSSAKKPYSIRSNAITAVSLAGYSLPEFLIGQILIILFAITLGLFPTGGMYSVRGEFNTIVDVLWHLALPAVSLAFGGLAIISRLTRASMLESLHQDYIVTARAKGLSERSVLYRHAFRNAMLPVITVISLRLSAMLAGDLLIEVVFSWPGLGRLLFDAMSKRDFPVIQGMFFLISVTVVTVTLFTDIIYARLDPRIRYSK